MTEQMFICQWCGEVVAESDIKRIRYSDGDAWDECPHCGNDELDPVEQCDECGKWAAPEKLYHGICMDCLLDRAANTRDMLEYGSFITSTVHVNALYSKVWSETQIDDILGRAFVNLMQNDMQKAAEDVITDDPEYFARYIKFTEEHKNA